jgi:hypothetical protein
MPCARSEWNELPQVELHGFEFIPACKIRIRKAARKVGVVPDQLDVGRRSWRDLFRRFLYLVGRYREASGLRPLRYRVYVKIDENWRAQFNIENLFNTGYWASADGNNNISSGQSRTFKVSARAKF